jgi:sulfite exporter TauE/SafE
MLAFGIGTLPAILGVGFLSTRLISHQPVRQICGAVIIAFGVAGLVHASGLFGVNAEGVLCRL